MKIDWTKPLTLCWCGFEFHGTQYSRPYLDALAETINEMHLRTHEIEARTAMLNKRREIAQAFIDSITIAELDRDIIAGNNGRR